MGCVSVYHEGLCNVECPRIKGLVCHSNSCAYMQCCCSPLHQLWQHDSSRCRSNAIDSIDAAEPLTSHASAVLPGTSRRHPLHLDLAIVIAVNVYDRLVVLCTLDCSSTPLGQVSWTHAHCWVSGKLTANDQSQRERHAGSPRPIRSKQSLAHPYITLKQTKLPPM